MTSYQAYGNNSRASPTPYTGAAPHQAGDGQFYPPGASRISLDDDSHTSPFKKSGDVAVDMRRITRTPSPTPSEAEELKKTSLFDWKAMASWRYWIRREWLWYYVVFTIAMVSVILFTVYHTQIVKWLQPAANWMHALPAGWLIPIAILFVISFPPLFGHEIVAIICGLVWGLGVGFAIVCAGTFLGELGNFYAFKYCCTARGDKLEKTDLRYACMARVIREGGVRVALITRLSAIPGHFSTAVFSTCGMSVWTFIISAFLSLPKQFITVYLGVALEQSDNGGGSTADKVVKDIVLAATVIITFVAMWYIYRLMNQAKPAVIYARRKARQAKLMGMGGSPYGNSPMLQSNTSVAFNPSPDESEVPLTARAETFGSDAYQQWDSNGRAIGHADPTLYMPEPRRAAPIRPFTEASTYRPQGQRQGTGASMGSAYQMSERGGYQSAPARSDTMLTNPYPYAAGTLGNAPTAFTSSPPPMRAAYATSPPAIPPPMSHPTPPQSPRIARPLQTAPAQSQSRNPYAVHSVPTPPPITNPYSDPYATYAPSPPPSIPAAQSAAYGMGSAPSSPHFTGGYPYGQPQGQGQLPGSAPLPASYSHGFAQQQQQQYPQTAAPQHGGYSTYESSTSMQSQAGSLPPSYSTSELR